MLESQSCNLRCIVLIGVGHTHAEIIRRWAEQPFEGCRLVCITNFPFWAYSGMLPAALAERLEPDAMRIDLPPLVRRAGAELIYASVASIDHASQTIFFEDSEPLQFDTLSIGIGSVPADQDRLKHPAVIPIKPMQTFIQRFDRRLAMASEQHREGEIFKIAIIGGGVAGVEVAMCLDQRMRVHDDPAGHAICIVTGGDGIADGMNARSISRLEKILHGRQIEVIRQTNVVATEDGNLVCSDGRRIAVDCGVLATGADAPPTLARLGLPTDRRGFIATEPTLQSTSGVPVFAVGDSGTIVSSPHPKAGVYAVRQAPVLWHNLHAMIAGRPLKTFKAQDDFLKILNCGDGTALLQYKAFSCHARWCYWLKTWIDQRFVAKYLL